MTEVSKIVSPLFSYWYRETWWCSAFCLGRWIDVTQIWLCFFFLITGQTWVNFFRTESQEFVTVIYLVHYSGSFIFCIVSVSRLTHWGHLTDVSVSVTFECVSLLKTPTLLLFSLLTVIIRKNWSFPFCSISMDLPYSCRSGFVESCVAFLAFFYLPRIMYDF